FHETVTSSPTFTVWPPGGLCDPPVRWAPAAHAADRIRAGILECLIILDLLKVLSGRRSRPGPAHRPPAASGSARRAEAGWTGDGSRAPAGRRGGSPSGGPRERRR